MISSTQLILNFEIVAQIFVQLLVLWSNFHLVHKELEALLAVSNDEVCSH